MFRMAIAGPETDSARCGGHWSRPGGRKGYLQINDENQMTGKGSPIHAPRDPGCHQSVANISYRRHVPDTETQPESNDVMRAISISTLALSLCLSSPALEQDDAQKREEIGRASCRERECKNE